MMLVALGEILVVVLVRPLRFLCGGERTAIGRLLHRVEEWLLHQLHVINAESRMRYEIEKHGEASAFLADGLSDGSSSMPSTGEAVERARRVAGADQGEAMRAANRFGHADLGRGQRQVETRGGDRSEDIQEALLEAQRRQNRDAERERRHNLRRR